MKIEAEIQSTRKETHDVKTLELVPERKIDFVPGQYCLVSMDVDDGSKGRKPFTFASPPTRDHVELTIKRMGDFTEALHNLKKGDRLILDGPRGNSLNFDESVDKDVVFLAGGSGITPFISAIRYAIDKDLSNTMTLIFSNRTKKDIIYREELKGIDRKENMDVINTLTDSWPEDWDEETGLIDGDMLKKYVEHLGKKLWYICGPPPMIDSLEKILMEEKIPEENIRYEKWMIPGKGTE